MDHILIIQLNPTPESKFVKRKKGDFYRPRTNFPFETLISERSLHQASGLDLYRIQVHVLQAIVYHFKAEYYTCLPFFKTVLRYYDFMKDNMNTFKIKNRDNLSTSFGPNNKN